MSERGKFIVFEGVGGSGKSTQIKLAGEYLDSTGRFSIVTREPGGVEGAEYIRELIFNLREKGIINPDQQVALFFAARYLWIRDLRSLLNIGDITVLTDRSFTSTAAYQGFAEGADLGAIKQMTCEVMGNYMPNAVILLDISSETAVKRSNDKGVNEDPFDGQNMKYFEDVVDGYRKMAQMHWGGIPWYVVDGEKTVEEVSAEIKVFLDEIMEN